MKEHTSMKYIVNNYNKVYRVGYGDLQHLFRYEDPVYYNAGVYGWNCDIYVNYVHDIAVCTGYRNMRGPCVQRDLVKKYDDKAAEILKQTWTVNYEELKAALDKNLDEFFNELDALENVGGAAE